MHVAGMLLGCLLSAAVPDGRGVRSADIVAEAMQLPAGSAVTGQRFTLFAGLSSTSDRGQQLKIVRAYWRLVEAAADYTFCRDHVKGLEHIRTGGRGEASLRLAATTATAQLRDAELAAVRAQYELAEVTRLPAGSSPPLPADSPLVLRYDTKFDQLFAARTPPEGARLSDKTLPIQHQAIEDRAAAVQAAEDASAAVTENYRDGRGDSAAVVACSRELLRQQRAFIETVCAYNRNIADYALLVVPTTTTPQELVTILLGPNAKTGGPAGAGGDQAVRATSATEPILSSPMRQPGRNEPTLAPPRDGWKGTEPATAPLPDALKPVGKNEPPLRPPQPDPPSDVPSVIQGPMAPVNMLLAPSGPKTRKTNKPPIRPPEAIDGFGRSSAVAPLYPTLVAVMPPARAKQLAVMLYEDRSLPKDAGMPIGLGDCLLRDGDVDHRATVEAYWLVRQRAAECQVAAEQAGLLATIEPVVLERRNQPSGAADMLRLQTAQLAAKATMDDSRVALIEAQYALALRIGALADAAWPLASTLPHTGDYDLKLEVQPVSLRESWPVERLAAMVPGLKQSVQERAAAVVDADDARVSAIDRYAHGGVAIDQAIEGVDEQTKQTFAFLGAVSAYNRAIAEYATTVLRPNIPANKLAAALVPRP
ncbi:MAG: hypothetical protein WCB27_00880 [Thermoguttaceae bacterium]